MGGFTRGFIWIVHLSVFFRSHSGRDPNTVGFSGSSNGRFAGNLAIISVPHLMTIACYPFARFSHVPHNISTFKLLEPHRSYVDLYKKFVDRSVPAVAEKLVESWPVSTKQLTRTVFATLFPRGLIIRTTQIVGSFIILNGTINFLQLREHHKIQMAVLGR